MKVLIVHSGNSIRMSSFVAEQAEALTYLGVRITFFGIKGKGALGYLKNLPLLKRRVRDEKIDIVHAHYGLSGLLASLQKIVPTIVTFHGSDINIVSNRLLSFFASRLVKVNIFVHPDLPQKIWYVSQDLNIIPCGVKLDTFHSFSRNEARNLLGMTPNEKCVLFSSSFDNKNKNYPLARKALDLLTDRAKLIELKGYARDQVALLMNAVDVLLVTSFSETGPLVVKEAMACNCPVVATDVGDIAWLFGEESGYYLCSFDPVDVAAKLKMALEFTEKNGRTKGRDKIIEKGLDSEKIARRIINVYESVLKKNAR